MNLSGCANCFLHGWKQVEDLSTLQRCTRCKVIQYCGRECQAEHWKRIHKKQCKYFADPVKAQRWGHNEKDCVICLQAAQVGKAQLCQATNPNYECILKENFPPLMYHPHPFPITGQPGYTYEKITIVLWQLLKKFELTQPGVLRNCHGKLAQVYARLKAIRLDIWKGRKISRQSVHLMTPNRVLSDLLETIRGNVWSDESTKNLFQIIQVVHEMLIDVVHFEKLQLLINPLADIPSDLHKIVSQAVNNSHTFLATVNHILDALTNQEIPFEDLLRIVCGGSLDKRCNFCSANITIAGISRFCEIGPGVSFSCLSLEIYFCGSLTCQLKANPRMMGQDYVSLHSALWTTLERLASTRCDFCSKLPPSDGGHRCRKCLTVIYCSTNCQEQDWEFHEEFCKEEAEERKKKAGSSGRRNEARDGVERMEEAFKEIALKEIENPIVTQLVQGAYEDVSKFKLKDAKKKTKK